ncbi:MAG: Holliday junction resolvase RuvX [Acidobacteriota bacterium]|nr:Holliday junction resolvase RuvX [Acidobacteriota bacterium]
MRWMGIDIGQRRYGVAVSDEAGGIAYPLTTLSAEKGGAPPIQALAKLVAEKNVVGIVVGLPTRMDGRHGPEARKAEFVAEQLRVDLGKPVELWDERLTTAEAERLLVMAGVRRKKRRGATDRIAAAIILQSFLDRQKVDAPTDLGTKAWEDGQ